MSPMLTPLDLIRPNHAGQFEFYLHLSQTKQVILACSWIDMVRRCSHWSENYVDFMVNEFPVSSTSKVKQGTHSRKPIRNWEQVAVPITAAAPKVDL